MNPVANRLQPVGKALPIDIPVAHRIPPEAFGTGIPARVNEENLGSDLGRRVNPVIYLLRRNFYFRADSRDDPRAMALCLGEEHTFTRVTKHGLHGSVQ